MSTESWGRGITPNEEAWVGELIDAELAKRDAEIERLRFALDRIAHHGPPMGAYGDYRVGAIDMASTLSAIAGEALDHESGGES